MSATPTEKDRRLAEALRANLRRRKSQARERDDADDAPAPVDAPLPGDALPLGDSGRAQD